MNIHTQLTSDVVGLTKAAPVLPARLYDCFCRRHGGLYARRRPRSG